MATAKGTRTTARKKKAEVVEEPKRQFDMHEYVVVRSAFHGVVVYVSKSTGEKFVWNEFGEELDLELKELRDMKSRGKALLAGRYLEIDDPDVVEYLGLKKYYDGTLTIEEFDGVFELPLDKMEDKISNLPEGQKSSVAYRARQLYDAGEIDSIKRVKALEKALNIELTVE